MKRHHGFGEGKTEMVKIRAGAVEGGSSDGAEGE